ncbi:nitrogen regulation protein NR(I) [Pseudidiomarina insulisalsae]|uniref:DNA-binding transcriptional regulator NtrC n=1 Tax=Pseudidiomarina insulisalsae TaxID=575789 RepID=A0A432YR10_9GAMM|nr:nitrogen regulation protein NR(I) [Pseudidiomarina insulisalsae]RUO63689.1 nitrogen regulation protein NR(I) [Pseudidiomarina insulisalsae]
MQSEQPVWLLDDDSSIRWVLERALQRANIKSRSFADAASLYQALEHQQPAVLLTDIRMPGDDGLQVLEFVQRHYPDLRVIVMTAHSDLDSAVSAFQGGAFEYLAKPFDMDEVVHTINRALQLEQAQTDASDGQGQMSGIIGAAPAMQDVFRAIGRLSHSSATVLITGASGTGKELVARALHQHSPRQGKPFIALNMAAIPADLIESELFGHEKGAFTGATQRRRGRFEQADGGTLFLDEIGDMPLAVQTRLLRVLAEGQFYPVGSYQPVQVNVRIIAATHQNLDQRVQEKEFREDLFHRLNVIRLQIPTLAERRSDIPQLARHFLQKVATELNAEPKQLTAAAEQHLQQAQWPGNVRQLENTCRWLTVMAPGRLVDVADLPDDLRTNETSGAQPDQDWQSVMRSHLEQRLQSDEHNVLNEVSTTLERIALEVALAVTDGHKQRAAEKLGWGRNTLTRKLKELVKDT